MEIINATVLLALIISSGFLRQSHLCGHGDAHGTTLRAHAFECWTEVSRGKWWRDAWAAHLSLYIRKHYNGRQLRDRSSYVFSHIFVKFSQARRANSWLVVASSRASSTNPFHTRRFFMNLHNFISLKCSSLQHNPVSCGLFALFCLNLLISRCDSLAPGFSAGSLRSSWRITGESGAEPHWHPNIHFLDYFTVFYNR